MKKIILALSFVIGTAATINAQSLHIGGKFGANLGKVDGKPYKDQFNLGYQLGAFVELDLNEHIGIQPELLFSQTNTKIDSSGYKAVYGQIDDAFLHDKARLNYLSIPILLRINAGKLLTFHVGPQFSVLMNKGETLVENGKDAFKGGDFAAVLGAQINLGSLKVYGRYNIGLSDVNHLKDVANVSDKDKWTSQQIQVGLGFRVL